MSRGLSNFFVKKRRHRRTGSPTIGRAGEAIFYCALFAIGVVGLLALFFGRVLPEWRVNHEFIKNSCTVLDKRIVEQSEEDSLVYRPEIQIAYEVDGVEHELWTYNIRTLQEEGGFLADRQAAEEMLDDVKLGRRYVCWYDPARPGVAILARRGPWWEWLSFCVPLSLFVIGGIGLGFRVYTWNKSRERRSAAVQKASNLEVFSRNGHEKNPFPFVPSERMIVDSPGVHLAYRLPVKSWSGVQIALLSVTTVAWNLIVARLAYGYIHGLWTGSTHWANILLVAPLAAFGVWLITLFFRRLFILFGVGPTLIEISAHPLLPGKKYRVFVSQSGAFTVQRFQVRLVCDEEATYRQGTNTRVESCRVYEDALLDREQFEILRQQPFESECSFELPEQIMHSFQAERNRVAWKIVVDGEVDGWPPFHRVFPIVVHPLGSGEEQTPS